MMTTMPAGIDRNPHVDTPRMQRKAPAPDTKAEELSGAGEQGGPGEGKKEKSTPTSYLDDPALRQMVSELQARDSEVRAHEAAHIAAGGGIVRGGASFSYQKGPDGKMYAIGGEVPIDASSESTPEATISKMRQVRSAAMAPSNPSATDYKVAANAMMREMQARQELMAQESDEKSPDRHDRNRPQIRIDTHA